MWYTVFSILISKQCMRLFIYRLVSFSSSSTALDKNNMSSLLLMIAWLSQMWEHFIFLPSHPCHPSSISLPLSSYSYLPELSNTPSPRLPRNIRELQSYWVRTVCHAALHVCDLTLINRMFGMYGSTVPLLRTHLQQTAWSMQLWTNITHQKALLTHWILPNSC